MTSLKCRHQRPSGRRTVNFACLAIACSCLIGCADPVNDQRSRRFAELQKSYQQAETPADFRQVALNYETLSSDSGTSPSVLFNQANAWLQANRPGLAIAGYQRALLQSPRDSGIRANLARAEAVSGHPGLARPMWQSIFFWTSLTNSFELALLATAALLASLTTHVLPVATSIAPMPRTRSVCTLLFAALAGSCLLQATLLPEGSRGVVIVRSIDVRSEPASNALVVADTPLTDGQQFFVVDQSGDWIQVQTADSLVGWVASETVQRF